MTELMLANTFYILESIAIFSFALSGILIAKRKNFDPVGTYVIACVTAFGGGTIRDITLDVHPVYWISRPEYPAVIFIFMILLYLFRNVSIKESWLLFPDSLGISLFAITTAQTAVSSGYPIIIVAILSTMAACSGGVICDILCLESPRIFKKETSLYASVVFVGACVYFCIDLFTSIGTPLTMLLSSLFTIVFRLLAIRYKWRLNF